jgi:hypothetical protein
MALDRVGQLKILQLLAQAFPNSRDTQRLEPFDIGSDALNFQLAYLQQHGLISGMWSQEMGNGKKCIRAEITARGLDFIAADGGLTAILGVVTIKLDSAQWAELLARKVESLDSVSPEERSSIADALRKLPAQAIEKVSGKMLDWAVDHADEAIPLLKMLLLQGG